MGKRILIVGSGGREHALVKSFLKSSKVEKVFCAPGNAGIARDAICVDIKIDDIEGLVNYAQRHNIDMTVIGPEAALEAGVSDAFANIGLKVFGPSKSATQIESSKEFAKKIMEKAEVPTASYRAYDNYKDALEYIEKGSFPIVIKFDGLAAGKGVVIAKEIQEARNALKDMFIDKVFGDGKVIIEEFLKGREFSFMSLVNGEKVYPLELAQDHKRAFDGDEGPNTGGMGAYSPVPFISDEIRQKTIDEIIRPVAKALVDNGIPFCGVLYAGLILTESGPKVIEFNARFGDPETEVVLPRLESDIYDFIEAVIEGKEYIPEWSRDAVLGVVLASRGYPGKYEKGALIKGLDIASPEICHMGTDKSESGFIINGGRVLMVIGRGDDLAQANLNALQEISKIECPSLFHRTDIGKAVLKR